jgi:putative glutamine amidotransferase
MTPSPHKNLSSLPLVGVPTCRKKIGDLDYDCTQHKYIAALYNSALVLPLQIPLLGREIAPELILSNLDGIFLTGSHSNIHPRCYEDSEQDPDFQIDPERDETVLGLIKPAIESGVPLLAVCRGFQELNVAYGGTLHSRLDLEGSFNEHREAENLALEQRYDTAHKVELVAGGQLHRLLKKKTIEVNSLHGQGVKSLGENLFAEAHAEDGLVEAVSVRGSRNFAMGVQWHPEWKSTENAISTVLFSEFGNACRAHK